MIEEYILNILKINTFFASSHSLPSSFLSLPQSEGKPEQHWCQLVGSAKDGLVGDIDARKRLRQSTSEAASSLKQGKIESIGERVNSPSTKSCDKWECQYARAH